MGLYKPRPRLAQLYETDNTIFSTMVLPDGLSVNTLTPALLTECGELDTIFTSAANLKAYMPIWCAVHGESWTRILAALRAEYNPIHNYDRTDTETESGTKTGTRAGSSSSSSSGSGSSSSNSSGTETRSESSTRTGTGSKSTSGSETGTETRSESSTRTGTGSKSTSVSETGSEVGTSSTSADSSAEKSSASAIVGNTSTKDGGQDTSTTDLAGFNSTEYAKDGQTTTEYGKTGQVAKAIEHIQEIVAVPGPGQCPLKNADCFLEQIAGKHLRQGIVREALHIQALGIVRRYVIGERGNARIHGLSSSL